MTTTPDIAQLEETLADIIKHPERWYQGSWSTLDDEQCEPDEHGTPKPLAVDCGTAFCFAGLVAQNNGGVWLTSEALAPEPGDIESDLTYTYIEGVAGRVAVVAAAARAQRLLGLNDYEVEALFSGSNTTANLRAVIEDIKNGRWRHA